MKKNVTASAKKQLYCVSYVDTVVREQFVSASSKSEAECIVESEIEDAVHHHAIDAYHDDMQVEPVEEVRHSPCFECGS